MKLKYSFHKIFSLFFSIVFMWWQANVVDNIILVSSLSAEIYDTKVYLSLARTFPETSSLNWCKILKIP